MKGGTSKLEVLPGAGCWGCADRPQLNVSFVTVTSNVMFR